VYPGKVLNIVDFGCFVQLDMFRQSQGLVHISQLRQKGRVTSVSDVVSRGDKVMVCNYHLATETYFKIR
jgi:ATP-dependent RNA helicase DHX8/PRP22